MDNRKKLALIPAYMPDEALIEITKELHNLEFTVIVIDDGSQSEYDEVFNKAEEFAKVIRCKKNKGKGRLQQEQAAFPQCAEKSCIRRSSGLVHGQPSPRPQNPAH